MWVAGLYIDKGATLANFIIKNNYKILPNCICMKKIKDLYTFGGICPKLKVIILFYKIPIVEDFSLIKVLKHIKIE